MTTYRPDHNGECLDCDERIDSHGPQGQCPENDAQAEANETAHRLLDWYCCPRCGWVSAHPKDKAERYCGHCHQFEEPERP